MLCLVWSRPSRKAVNSMWVRFSARERGQGLVEYGLILLLIAVVCVAVVALVAPSVERSFQSVADSLGG
jgi:pilus assembly protein Flp/PilA